MEQKFTLGRNTKNDIVIDAPIVSNEHLEISIPEEGKLYIVDLDSTNKTKVNGRAIKTKVVVPGDDLFDKVRKLSLKNRTNFTKEFAELQEVYAAYSRKKEKLIKKHKSKPLLVRAGMTIGVMALVFIFSSELQQYRLFLIMGIGIIGGIFTSMGSASVKLKSALTDLDIELEKKYKCPKCSSPFSPNQMWKYWAAKKKCVKCKAIWIN